jgi:energy-coupling factor transport system permease protein
MTEASARGPLAGRAFHYRDTGSPLHRLGAGWKLAIVVGGSAAALAARSPVALAPLLLIWAGGYRAARLSAAELWQDTRWLVVQGAIVVALSALRAGADGVEPGARAAAQLALFFLPGALLLRTTSSRGLLEAVRRLLPERHAFALATSARFVPFFVRELHEIVAAQRLRGARLAPRDLWHPGAWRDWVECVGVPLAVRAIHTANEAALAAEVRGIAAGEDAS